MIHEIEQAAAIAMRTERTECIRTAMPRVEHMRKEKKIEPFATFPQFFDVFSFSERKTIKELC